jgi:hypothetical protein
VATWNILACDYHDDRLMRMPAGAADLMALARTRGGRPGSVIVVASSDTPGVLGALSAAGVQVVRRDKDTRKGLKDSIVTAERVCHRFAAYKVVGRVSSSVRALCRTDEFRGWLGVFVLEVPAEVFASVWARSAPGVKGLEAYQAWARTGDMHRLQEIIERDFDPSPIPEKLEQAFVGASRTAGCVRRMIVVAARSDCPVLIVGETGTGKEIVAHQIHELSDRRRKPFLAVNCAAISSELLESELFGHVPGAFTGANRLKPGLVDAAKDGVLFLDEVGDLNARHQAKVLRLLDSGDYMRVGSVTVQKCRARIVAATNRDLGAMVEQGTFRADLYYRLFSFMIRTPSLREHPADIPALVDHFWRSISKSGKALPADVVALLQAYPWRGNARELRGFLTSVFVMACGKTPNAALVREAFGGWTGMSPWHGDR